MLSTDWTALYDKYIHTPLYPSDCKATAGNIKDKNVLVSLSKLTIWINSTHILHC